MISPETTIIILGYLGESSMTLNILWDEAIRGGCAKTWSILIPLL